MREREGGKGRGYRAGSQLAVRCGHLLVFLSLVLLNHPVAIELSLVLHLLHILGCLGGLQVAENHNNCNIIDASM